MVRQFFVSLGAVATLALASGAALAQQYPTRPVTIVVPFAAGGPTDIVARSMADAMGRSVQGANFVVDNAAGAGGTMGVDFDELGAMIRAAEDARKTAIQTGTNLIVVKDGKLTRIPAQVLREASPPAASPSQP